MRRYLFGWFVLLATGLAAAAEPELHVVALSQPSFDTMTRSPFGARVIVDRPGKEVVLLVCGGSRIEWEITATPKTKLTKVIFGGRERQGWKVPFGVDAEDMSFEHQGKRLLPLSLATDGRIDSVRFRTFVQDCKKYAGLEIASLQAVRRFDHRKPFVVDAVQDDERLSSDFPKLTPAARVPKFRFEATRVACGKKWPDVNRSFGAFTQAGPAAEGFVPLPEAIHHLAFDPKAGRHYGIDDHSLYAVDRKLGTAKRIEGPNDKDFAWLRALTYDAKRERVIVAAESGLFEYATADGGKWKRLRSGGLPIVWHAKADMLLAFGMHRDPKSGIFVPTLYELNPDGTLALANPLGPPLFPSILGDYGRHGDVQLIDLGRDLALLVHCDNRDAAMGREGKPEAFLYVINPKSGKVQLAWKE